MKYRRRNTLPFFIIIFSVIFCLVQGRDKASLEKPQTAPLDQKLPLDPKLTFGVLDNGFRFYVRENKRPENRAELRLVVNAGSVLEDDDQQGLAHFVEHMAFNGTKNFQKHELIKFMESIGMRFGPGLNARTSFDETIYMLRIPTESSEIMHTAFQILEDWSHGLSFDHEEIDKERGVIIEEWRLGRGAWARMRDKQFPILFQGSRYAERLPIGKKGIIESFEYETLKRFYRDWYRPDMMAVIAVGDFDKDKVEALIKKHFSPLPKVSNPRSRVTYQVPDHEETLYAMATDKEATGTNVAVYHKLPLREMNTVGAYRQLIAERMYNNMLNQRFSELAQKEDPPFLSGFSGKGLFIRSKEVYMLGARVKDEGIKQGLEALFIEAERVSRHGFVPTELERQKRQIMRSIERSYTERDKRNSNIFVSEYIRNFLQHEPIPGIEYEFELHKRFAPEITLEEINQIGKDWISDRNRVVLVNAPEKEGLKIPSEKELSGLLESIDEKEITPYEDTVSELPLMAEPPQPGKIAELKSVDEFGITEWRLSNGVKVVLKPTDFKEDEILFRAFSPGGTSLASDKDFIPARTTNQVIPAGGLGDFRAIDLQKKLAGKVARVRPSISGLEESLSGNASPKDLETLFQLIHLTFTAPRADETMYGVVKNRWKAALKNRNASPRFVFSDTLQKIMTQNHFRARPLTVEMIDEMDLEKSLAFYKDRFADASDFTFIFVGNIDLEAMRTLVNRYLSSLPSLNRKETWRDVGIQLPKGVIKKTVEKGLEPQSQTSIVFSGPFQYDQQHRNAIRSMSLILQTRLRETIREELGGTYSIRVRPSYTKFPKEEYRITIGFGSDPGRVEELTRVIFQEIDDLKTNGASSDEVNDAKQAMYRDHETGVKQNRWLLNQLSYKYRYGEDPVGILVYPKTLELLSSEMIQEAAKTYLNTKNYVLVTLYPEKKDQ